ncbi:MAG: Lin1244/Lin1753 domain-containing protein [Bacteroidales bacterium]
MKKAVYFPLHTTHYSSVKSLTVRMNYDFAGYALYIMLWQKLAESKDRTLLLSSIPELAFDFRCKKDILESIINDVFEIENGSFYSAELNENLSWYDAKQEKASAGGKATQSKLSPEEKSKRGKELAEKKAEKAQANRDEALKKEIEEQLLIEKFELEQNEIEKPIIITNNEQQRTSSLGVTDNRNINGNKEEIEIENRDKENTNQIEFDTKENIQDEQPEISQDFKTPISNFSEDNSGESANEITNGKIDHNSIEVKEEKISIPVQDYQDSYFSIIEIQEQIEDYLESDSRFFYGDKKFIVSNTFTNYYKEYPNTEINIKRFEQILYAQLSYITMSMDVKDFNNYLDSHQITINTGDINNLIQKVSDNPIVSEQVKRIIAEVQSNIQ